MWGECGRDPGVDGGVWCVVRSRGIGGIALHVNLFFAFFFISNVLAAWIAGEDVLF